MIRTALTGLAVIGVLLGGTVGVLYTFALFPFQGEPVHVYVEETEDSPYEPIEISDDLLEEHEEFGAVLRELRETNKTSMSYETTGPEKNALADSITANSTADTTQYGIYVEYDNRTYSIDTFAV